MRLHERNGRFDPSADYDDGSCEGVEEGCRHDRVQLDAAADVDGGSCEYAAEEFDCAAHAWSEMSMETVFAMRWTIVDMEAPVDLFPCGRHVVLRRPMPDPSMTMPQASDDCGPVV